MVRGAVQVMLGLPVVGLMAFVPASASTPVRLVFDRAAATPHTLVVAKTAGKGALRSVRKRPLRTYFRADRLVPLGRLSVNRRGNGKLSVNVPNVAPGDYTVLLRGLRGTPALRPVASFRVLDGAALRTCDQSVYGQMPENWREHAHTVGPLHFIGVEARPARDRTSGEYAMKVLLLIDRGPPVTVSVAREDRDLVALMYIPGRFNAHRVIDQDGAVTFEPCGDDATTQFNGGFVFRHPLCARFQLQVERRPEPLRFALPLGSACDEA